MSIGVRATISHHPGGKAFVQVEYSGGAGLTYNATLEESDFTAAQITKLNDALTFLVAKAATKMGF